MATLMSSAGGWFDDFEELRREMDALMQSSLGPTSIRAPARGAFPAVNVGVGPETVDVYLLLPGLDPEKLDVSLHDQVLTVSGERPADAPEEGRAHLRERFSGAFSRSVTLPDEIDRERSSAQYTNGVLRVSFGRRSEARTRRIEVK